jgi:hypothetical protein
MTDTARVPRHLQLLGEIWTEFAHRLDAQVAPAMPIVTDLIDNAQVERLSRLVTRETETMQAWIERLTGWMHGPLAAALMKADIPDREMRRVAERFSNFTDELIERRAHLALIVADPAMRAAAPRIDAVYVALLRQVRDFVLQVAEALGPAALTHADGTREGNTIELSFTFTPNIDAEMAQFSAWLDRAKAGWNVPGSSAGAAEPAASGLAKSWMGVLGALLMLVPIALWGMSAIWVMLAIAALIWCILHPRIVLIVLLLLIGFGWS